MRRSQSSLFEVASKLTDGSRPLWTLAPEVGELYASLQERATFQIDSQRDISEGETRTDHGLAISPTQASMCVLEIARTAAFVRGIAQAVRDVHLRVTDRPVQVLYAGCGPFAVLSIPIMSLFRADQVQFSLLDIHPESVASARSVVESYDFAQYVTDYVQEDASQYDSTCSQKPDIIVSETMNVCLADEPLVMIACRLLAQNDEAILVPQRVRVDACLVDGSREFAFVEPDHEGKLPTPNRDRVLLGRVFELNERNARQWGPLLGNWLPAARVTIPTPLEPRYRPMLLTKVDVYGDVTLEDYDCSLTIPRPIPTARELRGGEILQFEYRLGKKPGLVCRDVSHTPGNGENDAIA